mgnify:FL=1
MKCDDLIRLLEQEVPLRAAESWDNSGFLVGDRQKEIKKIMITLDITNKAAEKAVKEDVDFILAHHPVIFSEIKQCTSDHFLQKKLLSLIEHGICCYGMHTNYDTCRMCQAAAKKMDFLPEAPLLEASDQSLREENKGIGMIGSLKEEKSLGDFAKEIKKAFELASVAVFGDIEMKISRAAIVPGSGRGMAETALQKGAQVLVTGDIGHHEGLDALDMGLCVIDAGHYGLEQIFIDDMEELLKERLPECEWITYKAGSPFQII